MRKRQVQIVAKTSGTAATSADGRLLECHHDGHWYTSEVGVRPVVSSAHSTINAATF